MAFGKRLPGFDYRSPGAYFLTICAHSWEMLFEKQEAQSLIEETWLELPRHFFNASSDLFVVMPNHFHAVLRLASISMGPPVAAQHAGQLQADPSLHANPASVGDIVRSFKSATTRRLHERELIDGPVWQPNYYDHVIRNQTELDSIREYIALNPSRWRFDRDNPHRLPDSGYEKAWGWLETIGRNL